MAWFKREKQKIKPVVKKGVPDGLWVKCPTCSEFLYKPELEKSLSVCRHCNHHFRIEPSIYHSLLLNSGSSKELFSILQSEDLLQFKAGKTYKDQLVAAKNKTGQKDAINCYHGKIE
ncbi:MAG: acetyl-CoA carboxylase carboxyl transferase subunit beta, partial [Candidatus Neomarinimicrobiota bacterium]|nr:acetyl-CoA carboxylase carboxyl transferase subunit beta [Candidatus Neomarinimicrobiota bacterium]